MCKNAFNVSRWIRFPQSLPTNCCQTAVTERASMIRIPLQGISRRPLRTTYKIEIEMGVCRGVDYVRTFADPTLCTRSPQGILSPSSSSCTARKRYSLLR
jgi:hypothetical protein